MIMLRIDLLMQNAIIMHKKKKFLRLDMPSAKHKNLFYLSQLNFFKNCNTSLTTTQIKKNQVRVYLVADIFTF